MLALCLTCLMAAGAQLRGDSVVVPKADFRKAVELIVDDSLCREESKVVDSILRADSVSRHYLGTALQACMESNKTLRQGLSVADEARLDAVSDASMIERDSRYWRWATYVTGGIDVVLGIVTAVLLLTH